MTDWKENHHLSHLTQEEETDPDQAQRTMERLMADDIFSGWGVRILSTGEGRYNPMGYHLGAVWPHDNSMIAAGFRRYGYDQAPKRIFTGLPEATLHFESHQLPELFCGFSREEYPVPVRYPVACHPQAWAAASMPYMIKTILGLRPDAFENRLHVVRPVLPDMVTFIELRGVRAGRARADLRFERHTDGSVEAQVLKVEGRLEIVIEHASL